MRIARNGGSFLLWLCLGFAFTLLAAAALPLAVGDRSLTVLSGSMSPTIETGDVVVTEPVVPTEVEVGDIVTFRDPEGTSKLYSHRVRRIAPAGRDIRFVTRGDANTSVERWRVPANGTVGRVVYRVPKLGFAIAWMGTPAARTALTALPALLLCWLAMSRIWRRPAPTDLGGEAPGGIT
jgi:signal peptidase